VQNANWRCAGVRSHIGGNYQLEDIQLLMFDASINPADQKSIENIKLV